MTTAQMHRAPEVINTRRLILRRATVGFAEELFATYCQDEEVARYLVWLPHQTIGETQDYLSYCERAWANGVEYCWVITGGEALAGVGGVGMISCRIANHQAGLGYVLARPYWRQGLMSEAAGAVLEWVKTVQQVYRVEALVDADNPASARVLERIGMQSEGTRRRALVMPNVSPEPRDCLVYAHARD